MLIQLALQVPAALAVKAVRAVISQNYQLKLCLYQVEQVKLKK